MRHHRLLRTIILAGIVICIPACAETTAPRPGDTPPLAGPLPPPAPPAPPILPPAPPVVSGTPHIFVASVDGSNARELADGEWPAWSPDGRRIAFHYAGQVWVMNADGTDKVSLVRGGHPAWSPDGAAIAFSNDAGIARMNADGSNVTLVVRHNHADVPNVTQTPLVTKPSWSADGKRIAFEDIGIDEHPAQIYVVNADGSNITRLNSPMGGSAIYAESDPAWSPDGRSIAHWSYGWGIAVVNVGTRASTTLHHDFPAIAYGAKPSWAPDGTSLTFSVGRFGAGAPELWVINSNGSGRRLLLSNAYDGTWSPDGRSIAFVRGR